MTARWEALFADLEAEAAALRGRERDAEVADRTRGEVARVGFAERLRSAAGTVVALGVSGCGEVGGRVTAAGPDWLLVDGGCETLVVVSAIQWARGLDGVVAPVPGGGVAERLALRSVLRAVARDRSLVTVALTGGGQARGTLGRVGADWVEIAEHDADEVPRPREVRAVRALPTAALAVVRRDRSGWV